MDDTIPLMRVTDGDGFVYWIEGHQHQDAVDSFGADITVDLFYAVKTLAVSLDDLEGEEIPDAIEPDDPT